MEKSYLRLCIRSRGRKLLSQRSSKRVAIRFSELASENHTVGVSIALNFFRKLNCRSGKETLRSVAHRELSIGLRCPTPQLTKIGQYSDPPLTDYLTVDGFQYSNLLRVIFTLSLG